MMSFVYHFPAIVWWCRSQTRKLFATSSSWSSQRRNAADITYSIEHVNIDTHTENFVQHSVSRLRSFQWLRTWMPRTTCYYTAYDSWCCRALWSCMINILCWKSHTTARLWEYTATWNGARNIYKDSTLCAVNL